MQSNQYITTAQLRELPFSAVQWTGGFWRAKEDACIGRTIAAVEAGLHDPENATSFRNFRILAGLEEGDYVGSNYWGDGDCYKWVEAAVYAWSKSGDRSLEEKIERAIEVIGKAQAPDGYLHTYVQLKGMARYETRMYHEDYNFGHLFTAAAAHHKLTGRDGFLGIALKAARCLVEAYADNPMAFLHFGWNPSHIMGLVDLYRVSGEGRFLELASTFTDLKGANPPVFETPEWSAVPTSGGDQNQDRTPLRRESRPVGHAVTGAYLYAGAADVCLEKGDPDLLTALTRIWDTLFSKQLYVTGAIGPLQRGMSDRGDCVHEAFDRDYRLPSFTAYAETCANIGNAMWNQRMLHLTADARYADVMELVMFNSGLSGQSIEGDRFRYTNPLGWEGHSHKLLLHDSYERWQAFDCYCCPPQLARTIAGLSRWAYSVSDAGLWFNLYGGNRVDVEVSTGRLTLQQRTEYPWDGQIEIEMEQAPAAPYSLFVRIPGWCRAARIRVNGTTLPDTPHPGNYFELRRSWAKGDRVQLSLPMDIRMVRASRKVEELNNKLAVMRGPVVYCLEDADMPEDISALNVHLPRGARLSAEYRGDLLGGVGVIKAQAVAISEGESVVNRLYTEAGAETVREIEVTMIPYFAWNNRGIGAMTVWVPIA